jgi:hypothetical protein
MCVEEHITIFGIFDSSKVNGKEISQEQGKVENQLLVLI